MRWPIRALVAALAVLLVVVAWMSVGALRSAGRQQGRPATQEQAHSPEGRANTLKLSPDQRQQLGIKTEPVHARVPELRLTATGKIVANPNRTVVIAPRTPGRVVKVQAQLGDTVEAGAVLALVDSVEVGDALAELAHAESGLTLAQSRAEQEKQLFDAKLRVLETARQQPSAEAALRELAKVELGRAKQEYISALAKREAAQAEHEREKLLVEQKIGARKDLVRAEKELLSARAEVDAVAEGIRLTSRRELLEAETALQQARSQRDKIRDKLRLFGLTNATIVAARATPGQRRLVPLAAPFKSTVIERQASEGQLLDAAAVPFRLADLSVVWALLDVPETEAVAVRVGQEAVVHAGRDGAVKHAGRVVYVGDVVEEPTRTVKVRVEIPNPKRSFKPGMFVTGAVATRSGGAVLMVPRDAVVLLDEGPVVFVDRGEFLEPRPIEIGPEVEGLVPVRTGLTAGEQVVTSGSFSLKAQLVKAKLGED